MPLNTAGINAVLDQGNEVTMWVGVGSGQTAGDQTSAQRRQVTFSVASGVLTDSGVPHSYTGTPGAAATNALFFSASTAGTFYGYDALSGDATFNAAGEYDITSLTVTGSST